jgi:hypothetical protein
LSLDRLESRLLAQRVEERIGLEEDQIRVTQPKDRREPLERLGAISAAPRRNAVH